MLEVHVAYWLKSQPVVNWESEISRGQEGREASMFGMPLGFAFSPRAAEPKSELQNSYHRN